MKLVEPKTDGQMSLEKAISTRRTIRSFSADPLSLEVFSQLLWAAHGITQKGGFKRAAPSAGALYPMDLYAVTGHEGVGGFRAGVFHYGPESHAVSLVAEGDLRNDLARASLHQTWMARAPLNLVITAEYSRITIKYGERGIRYAMLEAGHMAQNIFLQAGASGLVAGIVGAYDDRQVIQVLQIPKSHEPLLIMPVGYRR